MGRTKRQYASRFHSKSALFTLSQGLLAALAAILSYITRKKNIFSNYWNSSLQDFLSMFMHSKFSPAMELLFASGGQGDSFRENRPPGPPAKAFD